MMYLELRHQKKQKKNDDCVLVTEPLPKNKELLELVQKIEQLYSKENLIKMLIHNKYEKMVPFNLWFEDPLYQIHNHCQCEQNMRMRYYNSILLTPLVSTNNDNLTQIKKLLPSLSLYQPFYPETFYAVWEILQIRLLNDTISKFLHIGREERMGSMEAIMFYHERYQQTYQYNSYHCWLAGNEVYHLSDGFYQIMQPTINYLGQAYKVKFIKSTQELVKYHFISIDTIHKFRSMFQWENEELDLQAMLFYVLTALKQLEENGSMLVRINMFCSRSWTYLFHIFNQYFKEYTFFRPSTLHPFNSEIYLFLNKFEHNSSIDSLSNQLIKDLYRKNIYQYFHLNLFTDGQNPITTLFQEQREKWSNQIKHILKNGKKQTADYVTEWHTQNDLKQIKDLTNEFEDKSVQFILKTTAKNFKVKPILHNILYSLPLYQKLIKKRAELNYYKRIMDTKPSQIFIKGKNPKQTYLLTWEKLISQLDVFQNLKDILKKEYRAEMVTNAWIKMYDLITLFPHLLPSFPTVKTFHLCEAPGAFIAAVNHFITTRNQTLDWYAQTLRPANNSAALEDYFGLISSYPQRWLFGDENDNSGDITHSALIKYYVNHPLLQKIDFMTADAGLKCHPRELNEQEVFLGKINMGQIICILACLPKGKSAIFKTFLPMSEPLTLSMMYLVTHLFKQVNIVKPITSHSTNSEVYVVLYNYLGIDKDLLEILYGLLDDPKITSKTLLFSQIDKTFFKTFTDIAIGLMDRQISSLKRNYYYYYHQDEVEKFQETISVKIEEWLRTHTVFVLEKSLLPVR